MNGSHCWPTGLLFNQGWSRGLYSCNKFNYFPPGRFVSLPSYLTLCVAIMLWKGRWHLTLSYAMLGYYGILVLAYLWCLESFNTYCQICAHRNQTMMLHLLWLTCGTLNLLREAFKKKTPKFGTLSESGRGVWKITNFFFKI